MDNEKKSIEKPPVSASRKGQAAMEYLMTYGWAILVIVIVLAVLAFYLPRLLQTPAGCVFTNVGFDCSNPEPKFFSEGDDGELKVAVRLFNNKGKNVEVVRMLCTSASSGNIDFDMGEPITDAGQKNIIAGGSKDYELECKNRDNATMKLAPNSDFRGILVVWYTFEGELKPDIPRKDEAVLTGTVLEE